MRTVKDVSKLTGISVRTLHYYDEIGLLKPTAYNEAGYRLYDDKALETLQQILFFKEFELSLNDIRLTMCGPNFDKEKTLISQKKILQKKRDRLDGLIRLIDDVLKGENKMSFKEFSKEDIEHMFHSMISYMNEDQLEVIRKTYGDVEHFKDEFFYNAESEEAQSNFKKIAEWYGSKAAVKDAAKSIKSHEVIKSYQNRISEIYKRLSLLQGKEITSFDIKRLMGEYEFVMKQLFQVRDVKPLLLDMAKEFMENADLIKANDRQFGNGASTFIGKAIVSFYEGKSTHLTRK